MSVTGRLEHIGIGAPRAKYEETIQFYEQVFGWHLIKKYEDIFVFLGDGEGGRIEIIVSEDPAMVLPAHIALAVELANYDATVAALKATGVPVKDEVINPFGDRIVFFTDPSGNVVQIVGRAEPMAQ